MFKLHQEVVTREKWHGLVRPLYHANAFAFYVVVQAQVIHFTNVVQPVEVDMIQRETSGVLRGQDKGGAAHTVRDLHDETGCPILLSGKPAIYERLGFCDMGDYSFGTDELRG